jgi:hypothetical protein
MDGTNLTNDTLTLGREGSTTNIAADMLVVGNSQLQGNASSLTLYPFNLNTSVGGNLELNKNYGVYNVPYGQSTSITDGGFTFRSTNADGTAGTNLLRLQNTPANTSRDLPGSYTGINLTSDFSTGYQSTSISPITGGYRYITSPNVTVGKIFTNNSVLRGQTYKCIFTVCAVSSATDTNVYIEDTQTVIFQLGLVGSVMKQFTFYFTAPNSLAIYIGVNGSASIQRTIDYQYFSIEPFYNSIMTGTMNVSGSLILSGSVSGQTPNDDLIIARNMTTGICELARFLKGGYIWIGSSSPPDTNAGTYNNITLGVNHTRSYTYMNGNVQFNQYSAFTQGGNAGIGTTNPTALLDVNGALVYSTAGVRSDRRIKTDIEDVDDDQALLDLRRIKPKIYAYKDTKNRGTGRVYGFIAQEVKEVLQYAGDLTTDCIPNIYDDAELVNDILTFTHFNTGSLERDTSGQLFTRLKLSTNRSAQDFVDIIEVLGEHTVKIEQNCPRKDMLGTLAVSQHSFVYGQEVTNFNTLNKEAIWTVATAALQEVDRQLQAEKAKVVNLETTLSSTSSMMTSMLARLEALENK